MNATDRTVLALALLVVVGAFTVPRALLWFDPEGDNRKRYYYDLTQEHAGSSRITFSLWTDRDDAPLPPGFPAYQLGEGKLAPPAFATRSMPEE